MTKDEFNLLLDELGWTQGDAAEELGLSIRSINGYARGEFDIPKLVSSYLHLVVAMDSVVSEIEPEKPQ